MQTALPLQKILLCQAACELVGSRLLSSNRQLSVIAESCVVTASHMKMSGTHHNLDMTVKGFYTISVSFIHLRKFSIQLHRQSLQGVIASPCPQLYFHKVKVPLSLSCQLYPPALNLSSYLHTDPAAGSFSTGQKGNLYVTLQTMMPLLVSGRELLISISSHDPYQPTNLISLPSVFLVCVSAPQSFLCCAHCVFLGVLPSCLQGCCQFVIATVFFIHSCVHPEVEMERAEVTQS